MSNELDIELSSKLLEIGYKLNIKQEINQNEEIVSVKKENRYIEIVRIKGEKELWICIQIYKVNLGDLKTTDIGLVIDILKYFIIELVNVEYLFDNGLGFEYPKGIEKGLIGKDLIYEMTWKEILNNYERKKNYYSEMIQVCKILRKEKLTKNYVPFLSLNRLCFSENFELKDSRLPCIYKHENEMQSSNIVISEFSGKVIEKGNIKSVVDRFIKLIE